MTLTEVALLSMSLLISKEIFETSSDVPVCSFNLEYLLASNTSITD